MLPPVTCTHCTQSLKRRAGFPAWAWDTSSDVELLPPSFGYLLGEKVKGWDSPLTWDGIPGQCHAWGSGSLRHVKWCPSSEGIALYCTTGFIILPCMAPLFQRILHRLRGTLIFIVTLCIPGQRPGLKVNFWGCALTFQIKSSVQPRIKTAVPSLKSSKAVAFMNSFFWWTLPTSVCFLWNPWTLWRILGSILETHWTNVEWLASPLGPHLEH